MKTAWIEGEGGGGIQEASFIETIVLNIEFFNNLVCTVSPKKWKPAHPTNIM